MYESAVQYHMFAIVMLTITITLFYLYTQFATEFSTYKKRIRMLMPIYVMSLSMSIFTGIVMMASFDSNITTQQLAMIFLGFGLTFLEVVRHMRLLRTSTNEAKTYVRYAKRVYAIELIAIFAVTFIIKSAAA